MTGVIFQWNSFRDNTQSNAIRHSSAGRTLVWNPSVNRPPPIARPVPDSAGMANSALALVGRYRWKICALLFFATTVNYLDRQVLGILAPVLQKSIGWNEAQYGYIVTAFQAAYGLSILVSGRIVDRLGTRMGYTISVVIWGLASMAHSLVRTPVGFGIARFALGIGEAGNFPAAIKAVAEWFPRKERALAVGIFNSGTNCGAVLAPLAIPGVALRFGWRAAFLFTGITDFIWLMFWLAMYRNPAVHPKVSREELAYIQSDPPTTETGVPLSRLLMQRQTWAYAFAKIVSDPVWWFYLFWLPKFLTHRGGLSLSHLGLPLAVIYVASSLGSVAGGWLSSFLLKRNWAVNRARKTTLLLCACLAIPAVLVPYVTNLWLAVALISLATAAHQGWSTNLFTTVSDMFPQRTVGSVVGIGGTVASVGSMLAALMVGIVLQRTGSYNSLFFAAGTAYLVALAGFQLLAPRLSPAEL
jgi:ACS family hexuronate transporter-like MFS transporter